MTSLALACKLGTAAAISQLPTRVKRILRKYGATLLIAGPAVPILGPELVSNGAFDTADGWSMGAGWGISGGVLNHTAPSTLTSVLTVATQAGKTYQCAYSITSQSAAGSGVSLRLGSTNLAIRNAVGTYSETLTQTVDSTTVGFIARGGSGDWIGSIDNLSVREIVGYQNTYSSFVAGNYRESTGNTLAGIDQQVGLVVDAARTLGPELLPTLNFNSWLPINGATVVSDTSFNTTVGGGMRLSGLLTPGKMYAVTVTFTISSGTLSLFADSSKSELASGVTVRIVSDGTGFLYLRNSGAANTVVSGISVRELPGIHASQATSGFQPVLRRGPVNLWTQSHDAANVAWVKFGGCIVTPGIADPSGGNNAQKVTRTIAGPSYLSRAYTKEALAQPFTLAAVVKRDNCRYASLRWQGAYPNKADGIFDLQTGSVHSAAVSGVFTDPAGTIFPLGNGFYLCAISATSNAVAGTTSMLGFSQNAQQVDGTDAVADASCVVYGIGLFQGAITAEQISLYGGIPVSSTAPASSINGSNSWQFDPALSQRLALSAVPFQMSDDHFVVAGATFSAGSVSRCLFGQGTGSASSSQPFFGINATGLPSVYIKRDDGASSSSNGTNPVAYGEPVVLSYTRDASGIKTRQNAVQVGATTAVFTSTATVSGIGANMRATPSEFHNGKIHCVILGKGAISDSELLTLEKFAAKLQGISL